MPLAFHIDPELQVYYLKIHRHVLLADLVQLATSPASTERTRAKLMVFDFLDGNVEVDLDSMHSLIDHIKGLEQTGIERDPMAILTNNPRLATFFGSFELLLNSEARNPATFGTLESAIAWVGMQEHGQRIHEIRNRLLEDLRAKADASSSAIQRRQG